MWFLGLVAGAVIGGAAAGAAGGVIGALLGVFIGWAISQSRDSRDEGRVERLEREVAALRDRVDRLERQARTSALQIQPAPAEQPEAATQVAPPIDAAPVAPPTAPASAPAPEAEAAGRTEPPAPMEADRERPGASVPAQVLGAIVGAIVGAAIGGGIGFLFGLLAGWGVVAAIQAQNRNAEAQAREIRDAATRRSSARATAPPPSDAVPSTAAAENAPVVLTPESVDVPPPGTAASASAADRGETPEAAWLRRIVSGNIVAKVGVLILFFGVGFLLKYAYDQGVLPVPVRLAGVALVGFAMGFAGWKLLATRRLYGLILQGGGIGLLYLDVFFALKVYGLVGPATGFVAFMALGVAATLLAVRQDARVLAVLGLTGAFLAPILASTGRGDHVMLFSYYTLLNAFILAISWFKAWRDLNLVGFVFTFAVGLLWGANNYRPELFATVEPFVLVFFAMYLVIPILFAQRQPPELRGLVDGTLVFGTPLCVAFMQSALVKDLPYGLAWSAAIGALTYALLALMTIRREDMKLLGETYVALAVVLLTLAIFFAFDAYPTFALWTLEGAAIVWVGLRQRRVLARWFGYALQLAGTAYFLLRYPDYAPASPFFNEFVIGCAFISAAGFAIGWLLRRYSDARSASEPTTSMALVWAAAWWSVAGIHALYRAYPWESFIVAMLVFATLTVVAFELVGARLRWAELRALASVHTLALAVLAVMAALSGDGRVSFVRPLAHGGYWAWPGSFVALFWIQARQARDGLRAADDPLFILRWFLIAALATWDAAWLFAHGEYGQTLAWGAAAIVVACIRFRVRERSDASARRIAPAVSVWGLVFWLLAGLAWIDRDLVADVKPAAVLAFAALSCFALEVGGGLVQWSVLRRYASVLPIAMVLVLMATVAGGLHPFTRYGWLTWPTALALHYLVLQRHERDGVAIAPAAQHVAALWIVAVVATWEAVWRLDTLGFGRAWLVAAAALLPAAIMAAVGALRRRAVWPFIVHDVPTYRDWALGGLALWLVPWMLVANLSEPGSMAPLAYLPLLNPLDVASACVVAALWHWTRSFGVEHELSRNAVQVLIGLAFVWVNCVLLRTIHYWADVPYEWPALSRSVLVQSGFSLLWTASAFVLMLYATRNARRKLWMLGAALLAVVVLKLFLNDLASTGTVARIVSFLGVGAGLLAIGYVAPVPPGDRELSGK